jgi:hypothetical protein
MWRRCSHRLQRSALWHLLCGKSGPQPTRSGGECRKRFGNTSRVAKPRQGPAVDTLPIDREPLVRMGLQPGRVNELCEFFTPVSTNRLELCFASTQEFSRLDATLTVSPVADLECCRSVSRRARYFARFRGHLNHETYIPTEQASSQTQARIPVAHAHPCWSCDGQASSLKGSTGAFCLGRGSCRSHPVHSPGCMESVTGREAEKFWSFEPTQTRCSQESVWLQEER